MHLSVVKLSIVGTMRYGADLLARSDHRGNRYNLLVDELGSIRGWWTEVG